MSFTPFSCLLCLATWRLEFTLVNDYGSLELNSPSGLHQFDYAVGAESRRLIVFITTFSIFYAVGARIRRLSWSIGPIPNTCACSILMRLDIHVYWASTIFLDFFNVIQHRRLVQISIRHKHTPTMTRTANDKEYFDTNSPRRQSSCVPFSYLINVIPPTLDSGSRLLNQDNRWYLINFLQQSLTCFITLTCISQNNYQIFSGTMSALKFYLKSCASFSRAFQSRASFSRALQSISSQKFARRLFLTAENSQSWNFGFTSICVTLLILLPDSGLPDNTARSHLFLHT